MKYTSQGFILFITLIILSVMSLLVLTSMQHTLLYYKAINKQEQMHRDFYQLETVAIQLARSPRISASTDCILHSDSANLSIEKLIQKAGCSLKKGTDEYQYIIEDLGAFPCLVAYKQDHKYATVHRRITVARLEEGHPASVVQIRFIKLGAISECSTKERIIGLGLSSWRYLASMDY